jgi:hypothetical protein
MPKHRPFLAVVALASLALPTLAWPTLAVAQPAASPVPHTAAAGSPATDDVATRLRGAPTNRTGAATRGLGAPHDAQPPVTTPTPPPAPTSTTGG